MKKQLVFFALILFVLQANSQPVSTDYPYNINTTFNGNPAIQMGIAWFTNASVTGGVVQIVEGKWAESATFSGAREIPAVCVAVDSLPYRAGEKRSYTSNKVLIDQLYPNTTYSYRVGKEGAWSPVGRFTTASLDREPFDFIYITDTQADTDEHFDISKKTIEAAYQCVPGARFVLMTGDHVDSAGARSAEWEWEQWFEKMQNVWLQLPIATTQGNHDSSPFGNLFHHFNIETNFGETIYSFVYGDALFLVLSYEGYRKGDSFFSDLESWMRQQIAQNPDLTWRIAAFHKTMFTGAAHQNDADGRIVRERMAPLFKELGIDLAIQGHDHVYEVIESDGVLYFVNNSAGKKKYYPHTKEQMEADFSKHGVNDYFGLFKKLEQTGEPTFSHITVSTSAIYVSTYAVSGTGETTLLDTFTIQKH
ncbi:MAG: metallophosphoesterase family protein [Bacteroidetes bacterium]|nr:metallophosphoesterase family protein [Bacteroidota bacterium]